MIIIMANNKNNAKNGSAQKDSTPKKKEDNGVEDKKMVEKVNQQISKEQEEESTFAKVVGLGLILLGFFFIVLAIIVVVISRGEPKVDGDLTVPTIEVERFIKDEKVIVVGETDDKGKVMFYLEGDFQDDVITADDDGDYRYEFIVEDEGEYEIEAVTVEGFPVRRRSEKSETAEFTVDWSAPEEKDVTVDYDPVSEDGKFIVSGTVEPYAKVTMKGDGAEYTAQADEDGNFVIEGIELENEEVSFTVTVEDQAGNTRVLDEEITVVNTSHGDLNGDGVVDAGDNTGEELPESAGEFAAAMEFLMENKLMMVFGLLALIVLGVNSGFVAMKLKRQ